MSDKESDYRISQSSGVPWRDLSRTETHRPGNRDIEMTRIETMVLAGDFSWGVVKVETDTEHYDLGETHRAPAGLLEFAEGLGIYLLGENL